MCEETKCDWKCRKPTTCPKPKCELQCAKSACEAKAPRRSAPRSCCSCKHRKNVARSMIQATESMSNAATMEGMFPSLIEAHASFKADADAGVEGCCACAE